MNTISTEGYEVMDDGWQCVETQVIGAHTVMLVKITNDGCLYWSVVVDCIVQSIGGEECARGSFRRWGRWLKKIYRPTNPKDLNSPTAGRAGSAETAEAKDAAVRPEVKR